ncbi:MAG: hypothetical protein D6702_03880, partial [Planctomycetota bacterium]
MSALLLALAVLLPLWTWIPQVLDPARLGGGLLALPVLALAAGAAVGRRPARLPRGGGLILLGLACGLPPLLLGGPPPWGGLADRAPLAAALALA